MTLQDAQAVLKDFDTAVEELGKSMWMGSVTPKSTVGLYNTKLRGILANSLLSQVIHQEEVELLAAAATQQ